MDVHTQDERALALAHKLDPSQTDLEAASWVNPATGTICHLMSDGDFEVWSRNEGVLRPVVIGRITHAEAAPLLHNPYSIYAKRAAANAIVSVDCVRHRS